MVSVGLCIGVSQHHKSTIQALVVVVPHYHNHRTHLSSFVVVIMWLCLCFWVLMMTMQGEDMTSTDRLVEACTSSRSVLRHSGAGGEHGSSSGMDSAMSGVTGSLFVLRCRLARSSCLVPLGIVGVTKSLCESNALRLQVCQMVPALTCLHLGKS